MFKRLDWKIIFLGLIFGLALPFNNLFAQQITSGRGSWKSIKTVHFFIHYREDHRRYAIETAHMAESVYDELEPLYKSSVGITHVSLVFETDTVNAFATTYGFDQIVLFLDQPRLGEFSRYHQWTRLLFIHEYTHILSLRHNHKRGNEWLYFLFGIPPNQISPFGLIEGTAVHQETKSTGVGRLKDPLTQMTVRAAIIENRYPGLGEIMNGSRRWPYAGMGYLYGSRILDQLVIQEGDDSIYNYWNNKNFPLNPNARLPYKSSLGKIYKLQKKSDEKKFNAQISKIKELGETKYKRLTRDGNFKRFLSINDQGELIYFARTLREIQGLYRIKPGDKQVFERRQISSNGLTERAGKKIYSEDYLYFSGFGLRHELYDANSFFMDRLATNRHISYPSLSSDGNMLAFVERTDFKRYLKIARLDSKNHITLEKKLIEVSFDGIIQYTDISPDNSKLLSIIRKTKTGFAALYICNLKSNSCEKHLGGKAIITQPRFMGNGSGIIFSSDSNGIYNFYRYNPDTKTTVRLTRTLTGLFYPTPSKDGSLYALRYFNTGYDVVSIPTKDLLDLETNFFSPLPETEIEETKETEEPEGQNQPSPENETEGKNSIPKSWQESRYAGLFQIQPFLMGLIGPVSSLNLGVIGRDPLFRHSFLVAVAADVPDPQAVVQYDYTRYNLGLAFQYSGNYWKRDHKPGCINEEQDPLRFLCDSPWIIQENASGYVRYIGPGRYFSEQIMLGYTHNKIRNARRSRIVEYDARDLNLSGPSMVLLFGDTQFYPKSISPERGWRFILSSDYYTTPESKDRLDKNNKQKIEYGVAEGGLALYLPSFWFHHVNYLSGFAYTSYGPDREIQKVRLNRFVRGINYQKASKNFAATVFTYEYRLPLSIYSFQFMDDTPGNLINNIGLGLFVDYGATFDRRAFKEDWVAAYGLNVTFSLNIAYLSLPDLKISYAKGSGVAGESQVYISFNAGLDSGPLSNRNNGGYLDRIKTPYHKALPGFQKQPGYFRDPRAGGILE